MTFSFITPSRLVFLGTGTRRLEGRADTAERQQQVAEGAPEQNMRTLDGFGAQAIERITREMDALRALKNAPTTGTAAKAAIDNALAIGEGSIRGIRNSRSGLASLNIDDVLARMQTASRAPSAPTASVDALQAVPRKLTINAGVTNLRLYDPVSKTKVGMANGGAAFTVLAQEGEYYRVADAQGKAFLISNNPKYTTVASQEAPAQPAVAGAPLPAEAAAIAPSTAPVRPTAALAAESADSATLFDTFMAGFESRPANAPAQRLTLALQESGLLDANGVLTKNADIKQIQDLLDPKRVKEAYIRMPAALKVPNLPADTYVRVVATGSTYVFPDFPELGQVRIRAGMQLALAKPQEALYQPPAIEPIPTDISALPKNPAELAEIAKKCPVKILYSPAKGPNADPWGHTALLVDGKVYSYGRWGKTDTATGGTTGEGCLFVFNSLAEYAKSESGNVKEVPLFGSTAAEREKMRQFFVGKIQSGDTIDGHRANQVARGEDPTKKTSYSGASEYVISRYDVFNENCTTLSMNALEAGGGKVGSAIGAINLESRTLEAAHDVAAVAGAAKDTLAEIGVSVSTKLVTAMEHAIQGKWDVGVLPIDDKGVIRGTGTKWDGAPLMNLYYEKLSAQYGNNHVRLPGNLYAALQERGNPAAAVNLAMLAPSKGDTRSDAVQVAQRMPSRV